MVGQKSSTLLGLAVVLMWLPAMADAQDFSGRWTGDWESQTTSHRGRLSATFQQLGPDQVQARFRGTFAKVIPFRYRATLQIVDQQPGLTVFEGSRKLPLMGTFCYRAEMTDCHFQATYWSRKDRGTWTLRRR